MPGNYVTEPEVLTGHTGVICSTSIERIIAGRNAALTRIESFIRDLDDISILTRDIGGGTVQEWGMREGHHYDCWFTEKPDKAMKAITRNIDRRIWRDLMSKSGMLALMDAEARDEWHKSLEKDDIPAICEANILSTFERLYQDKHAVFERGVINVFRGLSWDYKTNSPCKFGKKIIADGLVSFNRWGVSFTHGYQRDQLVDLERMLTLLDGKTLPDNRADISCRLSDHIGQQRTSTVYDDELFRIHYFQKGSAHIVFKRPELIERLNDIIAKHYLGMLA
ncbi:TPA: DUF4942 domain-containing protein [Klebsiella oxytoca]|uniref:DUF4942 domain-containing protein n=1 Tax=Klebsiella oxytoca TaxID=571 RepID=UPI0022450EBD|nr:DUF4942 domain-containing protein [Klebsiella oxytoca]MCW9637398.1 DUF4942 domain-containing protein [Klebsiella oxytoca]HBM2886495.1 DUF4942 domain-containing protein [Klebsiella oxytoca]HBM3141639.1 DUF4942 domain-containing protein [Klebsiella oxytoca]